MAKLKMAPVIEEASGATGSSVFVPSKFGQLLRRNVTPANPNTTRQQEVRTGLAAFSAGWRSLTRTQQNGWNSLARSVQRTGLYGANYATSGQRLYVMLNQNLREFGGAITDPPATLAAPAPLTFSAAVVRHDNSADADSFVNLTVASPDAQVGGLVSATPPLSLGRFSFSDSLYRLIRGTSDLEGDTQIQWTAAYKTKYGIIPAGGRVAFKIVPIDIETGFAGLPVFLDTDITNQA